MWTSGSKACASARNEWKRPVAHGAEIPIHLRNRAPLIVRMDVSTLVSLRSPAWDYLAEFDPDIAPPGVRQDLGSGPGDLRGPHRT